LVSYGFTSFNDQGDHYIHLSREHPN
jgi:hypothetical protein